MKKTIYTILIIFVTLLSSSTIYADSVTDNALNYLKSKQDSTGKITSGFSSPSQWAAIAFAANGIDISNIKNPTNSLKDFLLTDLPTNDSATDWESRILAIVAIGENPTNFGGTNYLQHLETFYNNNQFGDTCSLNDDIFGLMALIASGNSSTASIKQSVLDFIISKQDSNGGFGWSAPGCAWYETSSDMTAAAIQSLQSAKENNLSNADLETSINEAKTYLLNSQNPDGGFGYFGSSDPDTTSWALMALNVLGLKDSSEYTNAKNYLLSKQSSSDGGFQAFDWSSSSLVSNSTTTAQSLIALLGKSWILKIFNSTTTSTSSSSNSIPLATSSATILPSEIKNLANLGYFSIPSTATSSATPSLTTTQQITINTPVGTNTHVVSLPQGIIISRVDGANFDSSSLQAENVSASTLSGLGNNISVEAAFQWGIANVGLEFTSPITINIYVGTSLNGQTLNISRSTSISSGWTNDGIVEPKTCVVDVGICSFRTIKASYFAATKTTSSSTSSSNSSSSSNPTSSPTPTPTPSPSPTPTSSSTSNSIQETTEPIPTSTAEEKVLGINTSQTVESKGLSSSKKTYLLLFSFANFIAAGVYWKFKLKG